MAGVEGFSEYDGLGVMPNTVYPKGRDALTPEDKLRLDSLTGQHEDSRAPVDEGHWYGNMGTPESRADIDAREGRNERQRQLALQRDQKQRYRESR